MMFYKIMLQKTNVLFLPSGKFSKCYCYQRATEILAHAVCAIKLIDQHRCWIIE